MTEHESEHESLRFALLDLQIVDADGRPVGRVDDLLLHLPDDGGPPVVTHVLTGAQALGERLGGVPGRVMAALAARLRDAGSPAGPARIPAAQVGEYGDLVHLTVPLRALPHLAGLERWLACEVVEGVPGAGDADD